eukprot:13548240-Alexandrium_andersonii.AAC.1
MIATPPVLNKMGTVESDILRKAVVDWLGKIPTATMDQWAGNIKGLMEREQSVIAYGTMCSGTDLVEHALNAITRALLDKTGYEVELHHAFSCEKNTGRRSFILKNSSSPVVFEDMARLCEPIAWDVRTDTYIRIPPTSFIIAGIECRAVSRLNVHRARNNTCIRDAQD